ncbi:hypothetical protein [Streptomyces malaysiensis]
MADKFKIAVPLVLAEALKCSNASEPHDDEYLGHRELREALEGSSPVRNGRGHTVYLTLSSDGARRLRGYAAAIGGESTSEEWSEGERQAARRMVDRIDDLPLSASSYLDD